MRRNPSILPSVFFHQVWYPPQKWIPFFEDPYALDQKRHTPKRSEHNFRASWGLLPNSHWGRPRGVFRQILGDGCRWWRGKVSSKYTLQGINISHLGKRKIIFKMPFLGDMLVPGRVCFRSFWKGKIHVYKMRQALKIPSRIWRDFTEREKPENHRLKLVPAGWGYVTKSAWSPKWKWIDSHMVLCGGKKGVCSR